jgi:hypothetical protein
MPQAELYAYAENAALYLHDAAARKGQIDLLKNNGKELFIAFIGSMAANLGLMVIYYYLHIKQEMFSEFDIPRFTTVAIVLTPVIAGLICYARNKKKDDASGAVIAVCLLSFAAAFVGCISGAALAAGVFGK